MFNPSNQKTPALYRVTVLGQDLRLNQYHVAALSILASLVVYLLIRQPPMTAVLVAAAVTATWAWTFTRSSGLDLVWSRLFPSSRAFSRRNKKLSGSYWLSMAVLAIIALGQGQPASAQFFNSLEQATTQVVAGSNSGIDPAIIQIIFILFRVLIVLAFVAGVVGLLTQAFRGGDWAPIASMLGIGIAFVIGVEVITTLMIGGTGGGGAAPGG